MSLSSWLDNTKVDPTIYEDSGVRTLGMILEPSIVEEQLEQESMTMEKHKTRIYAGIIIIALGVVMTANLPEPMGPVGLVFIGIGGFYFILGLRDRKKARSND